MRGAAALTLTIALGVVWPMETNPQGSTASPVSSEVVVLLHGVWRRAGSMRRLERALRAEGHTVISETYPSVRSDVIANADWLWTRLSSVEADRIHFVTHSMGALVLRQMLAEHELPRLGRVVMIAPPSRGALLADHYSRYPFFSAVMGHGSAQLRTGQAGLSARLPEPPGEFAIIAGRRGHPRGWHPLIPGDDDGTVGVSETYLPGASAFVTVRATHTFIMNHPEVIAFTRAFLRSGPEAAERTLSGDGVEQVAE